MPTWLLATVSAIISVVMLALLVSTGVLWLRLQTAQQERNSLIQDVEQLRDEVEALHEEIASTGPDGSRTPGGGLLDELGNLGGDNFLDDLFGGEGLFGGPDGDDPAGGDSAGEPAFDLSAAHGVACLTPDVDGGLGGLGDLFDGLFGDDGQPDPSDVNALISQVADQTATVRELTWVEPAEVDLLDDAAVRERLDELTGLEDDEEAALEGRQAHLVALGSLPANTDLAEMQRDLLGDAVAGFYVPETGETVVRSPGGGDTPSPADQVTLAHELGHALVDQTLGLPDRSQPPLVDDLDASLASLAVTEGDASLLMNLWALEHLSLLDMLAIGNDPMLDAQADMLALVPDVIVRELMFPYTIGLDWACDVYLDGGWAAVDAAYADLPNTTAEILFGTPVDPAEPADIRPPSPNAHEVYSATFGAAELLWQLQAPGGSPDAAVDDASSRAASWVGGSAQAWTDRGQIAASMSLVFAQDGSFTGCDTMTEWAHAAFPHAVVEVDGAHTVFDTPEEVVAVDCSTSGDATSDEQVRVAVAPTRPGLQAMLS